jgi:hypothetical protein
MASSQMSFNEWKLGTKTGLEEFDNQHFPLHASHMDIPPGDIRSIVLKK